MQNAESNMHNGCLAGYMYVPLVTDNRFNAATVGMPTARV
jgi:hypothetical protein